MQPAQTTSEPKVRAASDAAQLEQAMRTLSGISSGLLQGYGDLERRAQRVEEELCRTNSQLEHKVRELDRVTHHLEAVLEALPTGVVVRDGGGRIVRANPAATHILGVDIQRLFTHQDEVPGLLGQRAQGEALELECLDGERRVVASRFSLIDGGNGARPHSAGSVEILDDRTEVTELTERLHSLDKLAALGNMAGGIAHEIRNPMNAIKGFAALIAKHATVGTRQERWASRIVQGIDEADAILASMLTLATPEKLVLETIDARQLIDSAVALVISEQDARPHITCAGHAPPFPGDRIKLRQALRNLIVNGLDAQGPNGRVHVAASIEQDQVILCVSDAGPGIPEHMKLRIFDPFYTTRAAGTGLGLALVSAIVRLHGGRVEVSSKSGLLGGADISLHIPSARIP